MIKMLPSTISPKKLQSLLAFLFVALFFSYHLNAQTEFRTKWAFSSAATQVNFNALTVGAVSYTWTAAPSGKNGNGSFTMNTAGAVTLSGLNIAAGDTLLLSMAPTNLRRFYIGQGADRLKLVDVTRWGTVAWTSMQNAFAGCTNLKVSASDVPNLTNVTDLSAMFKGATYFDQNIGSWNTASVTNMGSMFQDAFFFNQDISKWNTAKVTDMSLMFNGAGLFDQDISSWNTANVKAMFAMFANAGSFNQNISKWNTAKVTVMGSMFQGAAAFNQKLGFWKLDPTVDLTNIFSSSGLDCDHYTATLVGWAANNPTVTNRTMGATGVEYGTSAVAARNTLINTRKWVISGDLPSGNKCDVLLSTDILPFKADLVFFPNPTTGLVQVMGVDRATYSIADLAGKVLAAGEIEGGSFSMEHLPVGPYIVSVLTDNFASTLKVWRQ